MVKFWKWVKETVRSFNSVRGLIALGVSFMIWYGWLLVFIVVGAIINNAWLYGVGITGVLLWAGPGTPFIFLFLGTATLIRKVVLRDEQKQRKRVHEPREGK